MTFLVLKLLNCWGGELRVFLLGVDVEGETRLLRLKKNAPGHNAINSSEEI